MFNSVGMTLTRQAHTPSAPGDSPDLEAIATRAIQGFPATADEALAILGLPDSALLDAVHAAGRVRRAFFANLVKVNYLVNLKSGLCPEDCGYCSQRLNSGAGVLKYSWLKPTEAARQAGFGLAGGASRVCLVASGRGPTDRDVNRVADMVGAIKEENPSVEVCACLGLLKDGQAERLAAAGVDAYNHNLNTARSHYPDICSTHSYDDRVDTVARARHAGLSPCSGLIVGMGETDEQLVEAITALRAIESDSIPVNFLIPFDGTPLAGTNELDPRRSLLILAVVRLMCPDRELRIAGGRELHLRSLQPLSLHVANSLFLGDYLTSEGQDAQADLDMIVDGGFEVVGQTDTAGLRAELAAHRAAHAAATEPGETTQGPARPADETGNTHSPMPCGRPVPNGPGATRATGDGRVLIPAIRTRGAGTEAPPNS